jgi:hypothetical protein
MNLVDSDWLIHLMAGRAPAGPMLEERTSDGLA